MKNNIKKIIVPFITFLLVFIIFIFINYINEERKEKLFDLRKTISTHKDLPSSSEIERRTKQIISKKLEIEEFLFDKNLPIVFIEDVEKLSFNNGLEIFIEDVQNIEIEKNNYLKMVTSVSGSLNKIVNFVDDIENFDKDIEVQFLRIVKNEKEEVVSWRADLILVGKTK